MRWQLETWLVISVVFLAMALVLLIFAAHLWFLWLVFLIVAAIAHVRARQLEAEQRRSQR